MSVVTVITPKNNYAAAITEKAPAVYDISMFDLAFWPLDEASGTVVNDRSGHGYNGTYADATLGQPGPMSGKTCPLFNGTSSNADINSAPLRAASGWTEYGIGLWLKVANAGVWTDGAYRAAVMLLNGSDQITIERTTVNNQIALVSYIGGVQRQQVYDGLTSTDWVHVALTGSQSNNRVTAYINGYPTAVGTFNTGITPNSGIMIGQHAAGAIWNWSGWLAHVGFAKHELSAAEVLRAATIGYRPPMILYIGDSISANAGSFPMMIFNGRRSGYANISVGGTQIMVDMANMCSISAAGKNADIIIVEMGTNDANDPAITATYTANINTLKGNNPRAVIYCMGILPRTSGGYAAQNNPRIQAACAAAGVTYLNTDSWIVPATDTSDGVHPNAGGYLKIYNQLMTIL